MDIEERDDDVMEFDEIPSLAPPVIPFDAAREDAVMATESTLNTEAVVGDGDVDLEEDDEEDDMEAEPTPIPAAADDAVADPFFATPAAAAVGETPDAARAMANETIEMQGGGGTAELSTGAEYPLTVGDLGQPSAPKALGESSTGPTSSPISPTPLAIAAVSSAPASISQLLPGKEDIVEEVEADHQDGEDEEEYYYEDEPDITITGGTGEDYFFIEDEYDTDSSEALEPGYDPDIMVTIDTLPPILLYLPNDEIVSLFTSPDSDLLIPLITPATPVWFAGRHAELAQVPLAGLLDAVKVELAAAGQATESKVLTMQEEGLGVHLVEDDKHLSQLTLLEYLQVHHACALPDPVRFIVAFEASRFWARFDAIRKELAINAEGRKLKEDAKVAEDDLEEIDGAVEDEDHHADEHASEGGVENQAQYDGSNDNTAKQRPGGPDSAHPHADWARTLATAPMAYGAGTVASPMFKGRRIEATHDDAHATSLSPNKGDYSKRDVDESADTTEASNTKSQVGILRQQVPLDEIELRREESVSQDESDRKFSVPKDEVEVKKDQEALEQGFRGAADEAGLDLMGENGDDDDEPSKLRDTPLRDSVAGLSASVGADTESSLPASSVQSGGASTPLPGSSLANEVYPDDDEAGEGDTAISEIPEESKDTADDVDEENGAVAEEAYEDENEEASEDVPGVNGALELDDAEYEEAENDLKADQAALRGEDAETGKTALQLAVDGGVISGAAAKVADPEYDSYEQLGDDYDDADYHDDPLAQAVDGEVTPTSSTTAEDDGVPLSEEADDDTASPLASAKRPAEDDDDYEGSAKRSKSMAAL